MLRSLVLALGLSQTDACTVFAVGKKATKDGSVLVSHSDDGNALNDARLIHVPAADHPAGSKRPIFFTPENFPRYVGSAMGPGYQPSNETAGYPVFEPIGYIDQVSHTYGYQSGSYGVINEHGVAVGESTCGAMFGTCGANQTVGCEPGRKVGVALMSIDTLSYLAMERCTSSRQAVEMMGQLALQHGFYGPVDSFEGSGESLVVADPDEAWAFQILSDPTGTSAIWAAQRLPDDHMTVVANMYTIREVDANDKANFILSPNLFEVAKSKGWWKDGTPFDFTKMYSGGEYAHKYYSGRRMWRGFQMASPSLSLPADYEDIRYKAAYPWSVKPDKLVSQHDVMAWHRDWYAGTEFDMTQGLQAGPFGTPDRFATSSQVKGNWERSIALYRTNAVYVQQLHHVAEGKPAGLASVAWYGGGPAHYAVFVPLPSGMSTSVPSLTFANAEKFESYSMNWNTRHIMNVCQVNFKAMHQTVQAQQLALEKKGDELLEKMRASKSSQEEINEAFLGHAAEALSKWRSLSSELLFLYSGNSRYAEHWKAMGYSEQWLEKSGYKEGPPPAPVEDRCPPKCDGQDAVVVKPQTGLRKRADATDATDAG